MNRELIEHIADLEAQIQNLKKDLAATQPKQITTVEELEALPTGTYLLGADSTLWESVEKFDHRGNWRGMDSTSRRSCQAHKGDERLLDHGPLTVVWQP